MYLKTMAKNLTPEEEARALDAARWEAVEESTELLHEEEYHAALLALRERRLTAATPL